MMYVLVAMMITIDNYNYYKNETQRATINIIENRTNSKKLCDNHFSKVVDYSLKVIYINVVEFLVFLCAHDWECVKYLTDLYMFINQKLSVEEAEPYRQVKKQVYVGNRKGQ